VAPDLIPSKVGCIEELKLSNCLLKGYLPEIT